MTIGAISYPDADALSKLVDAGSKSPLALIALALVLLAFLALYLFRHEPAQIKQRIFFAFLLVAFFFGILFYIKDYLQVQSNLTPTPFPTSTATALPTPTVTAAKPTSTPVVTPAQATPVPKPTPTPPEWIRNILDATVGWIGSVVAAMLVVTAELVRYFRGLLIRPLYILFGLISLFNGTRLFVRGTRARWEWRQWRKWEAGRAEALRKWVKEHPSATELPEELPKELAPPYLVDIYDDPARYNWGGIIRVVAGALFVIAGVLSPNRLAFILALPACGFEVLYTNKSGLNIRGTILLGVSVFTVGCLFV